MAYDLHVRNGTSVQCDTIFMLVWERQLYVIQSSC